MSRFLKERLRPLEAYTTGEQPKEKILIKLNTNESPYPPGQGVLQAVNSESLKNLNLYPSPDQGELKSLIAQWMTKEGEANFSSENIFVSNGSDDIINFAFMAFAGDGVQAWYPDITYGFYKVFAQSQGVESRVIPLDEDFRINIDDYGTGTKERRFIVIANPNAPTGIALSRDEIEEIVKANSDSAVLVDEAYIDFGGESAIGLVNKYDNLLISRTFSKFASLAGARLGFAVGNSELISDLEKIKFSTNPYSINRMTEAVGIAAVKEIEYYKSNCDKIIDTRNDVEGELKGMGFKVLPGKANFLFVGTGSQANSESPWSKVSGEELLSLLREKGILVRWFNGERTKDFLRITIGTPEEMKNLIEALREIG